MDQASSGPIDGTFWPQVKAQLRSDQDFGRLRMRCVICFDKLHFTGESRVALRRREDSKDSKDSEDSEDKDRGGNEDKDRGGNEVAYVMPCGHIVGHGCIKVLLSQALPREAFFKAGGPPVAGYRPPHCPFCKMEWQFKGCAHAIDGSAAPQDLRALAEYQRTVPEGAEIADNCAQCQLGEFRDRLEAVGNICVAGVRLEPIVPTACRRAGGDKGPATSSGGADALCELQEMARHALRSHALEMARFWNGDVTLRYLNKGRLRARFARVDNGQ